MFVPTTFAAALVMTILSTICWGSFANTFKLTKNYRFELYYWDYAAGIFLISLILAFTMGSLRGGDTTFVANLHSAAPMQLEKRRNLFSSPARDPFRKSDIYRALPRARKDASCRCNNRRPAASLVCWILNTRD